MKPDLVLVIGSALFLTVGCREDHKVEGLVKQGNAARQSKHYQEAISNFSEAIQLNPKSAVARFERGGVFVITGDFDKALADLNIAVNLNPENSRFWEMRGYAFSEKHRLDEAITNYNMALKLQPDNRRAFQARGHAYYLKHDYTNAIFDFTEALTLSPKNADVYHDRGLAYLMSGSTNEATVDFNESIRLNPDDAIGRYWRAKLYSKAGLYTKAVQELAIVINLQSNAPSAHNALAWILATCPDPRVRDGVKAVELATTACGFSSWTNYAYVDTLAAAYAETGDFDQAVKYQRQAASFQGIPMDNRANVQERIDLYLQHKPYRSRGNAYDF